MKTTSLLTLSFASVAVLAGCVEDTGPVASGRATMAEVERACVSRLARESMIDPASVTVMGSTGSSDGVMRTGRETSCAGPLS